MLVRSLPGLLLRCSLLLLVVATVLSGCRGDGTADRTALRQAMLNDIGDRVILPAHDQAASDAAALVIALEALEAAPSAATLDAAQAAWLTMAKSWRHVAAFNLRGPVKRGLYHNRINSWPTRPDRLEEAIADARAKDVAFVQTKGSTTRGLPAIEYLIFDASGDSAVLDSLAGPNGESRRALARAIAQDVAGQSADLVQAWSPNGGDALGTFIAADTEGRFLRSSVSRLVNELSMLAEDLRYNQLGAPLGISRDPNDPRSTPDPMAVEAPYAGATVDLLRAQLVGMRTLVTANDGVGLDDYLASLDAQIDGQSMGEALLANLDALDAALAAIPGSMRDALAQDPEAVQSAYDEAVNLLRLVKTDVAGWLGISITFSDNDGD
ncbi:MAG: imelysin family protein [Bacteroidota bacterium]